MLVVLIVGAAGLIIFDAATAASSTELTNVTYTDAAGNELVGYLAEPTTPGPHPAVLLIHEWWGLNEGMIVLADALAEQGYVVLAADAYRGKLTESFLRAIWLVTTTPEAQAASDLDAAVYNTPCPFGFHLPPYRYAPLPVLSLIYCFLATRKTENDCLTEDPIFYLSYHIDNNIAPRHCFK